MNTQTKIKVFILLCALPTSHIFSSRPAPSESLCVPPSSLFRTSYTSQAGRHGLAKSDPLEAKLHAIDVMPNAELLSTVVPLKQEAAKIRLDESIKQLNQIPCVYTQIQSARAKLKLIVALNEYDSCNDEARKQYLQAQCAQLKNRSNKLSLDYQESIKSLIVKRRIPTHLYNGMLHKCHAMSHQASLLLAKNENLQQEKNQWQEKEQSLLARIEALELAATK